MKRRRRRRRRQSLGSFYAIDDTSAPSTPEESPDADPMTFEDQLVRLLALLADALDSAPGDTALMLRRADTLLRAMQAEERLLGGDKTRLSKNLEVILSRFGDLIVPPDR